MLILELEAGPHDLVALLSVDDRRWHCSILAHPAEARAAYSVWPEWEAASTNQPRATPWEKEFEAARSPEMGGTILLDGVRALRAVSKHLGPRLTGVLLWNERVCGTPLIGDLVVRPRRSQGVALGWFVKAPLGQGVGVSPTDSTRCTSLRSPFPSRSARAKTGRTSIFVRFVCFVVPTLPRSRTLTKQAEFAARGLQRSPLSLVPFRVFRVFRGSESSPVRAPAVFKSFQESCHVVKCPSTLDF